MCDSKRKGPLYGRGRSTRFTAISVLQNDGTGMIVPSWQATSVNKCTQASNCKVSPSGQLCNLYANVNDITQRCYPAGWVRDRMYSEHWLGWLVGTCRQSARSKKQMHLKAEQPRVQRTPSCLAHSDTHDTCMVLPCTYYPELAPEWVLRLNF